MKKIPTKWWVSPLMMAVSIVLIAICYLVKSL
nr:MAG TPA: hypothetical protein [Caudoviricetes sp.]